MTPRNDKIKLAFLYVLKYCHQFRFVSIKKHNLLGRKMGLTIRWSITSALVIIVPTFCEVFFFSWTTQIFIFAKYVLRSYFCACITVIFLSGFSWLEQIMRAKEKNKLYGAKRGLKEPDMLIRLQNNQIGNLF